MTTTRTEIAEIERARTNRRASRRRQTHPKTPPSPKRTSRQMSPPEHPRVTKQALMLQLLNHTDGATLADMMQATGWQQHSVRGFLAGTVKTKLSLQLTSSKIDGEPRRYRIKTSRRGR